MTSLFIYRNECYMCEYWGDTLQSDLGAWRVWRQISSIMVCAMWRTCMWYIVGVCTHDVVGSCTYRTHVKCCESGLNKIKATARNQSVSQLTLWRHVCSWTDLQSDAITITDCSMMWRHVLQNAWQTDVISLTQLLDDVTSRHTPLCRKANPILQSCIVFSVYVFVLILIGFCC